MSPREATARGERWHAVWTERDEDRADWNGYEKCFDSFEAYETWTKRVASLIVRELRITHRDHVVDLGCGSGRITSHVAEVAGHVTALDYSETVLDVARRRRARANVTYQLADLNTIDSRAFAGRKGYATGSLFYLDSLDVVRNLISAFVDTGGGFAAIDLPDADTKDDLPRDYDTSEFTHLAFDIDTLRDWFPTGRIVRIETPQYAHAAWRFNFVIG